MNPLQQKIAGLIRVKGPITFEKFMSAALYDPEFGYYNTQTRKIGREGDFYTSSYLHPVFGAIIARQIQEMWDLLGRPDNFRIVEMGAGAGYFCKDLLDSLKHTDFMNVLQYTIIEQSPVMMEIQQRLLSGFSDRIEWASALKEYRSITGCIFSNELLDAFPVHLVRMEDNLKEVYLDFDEKSGFIERTGDLSIEEISHYFRDFSIEIEKGHITEVNLRIKDWLNEINGALERGFIITIDYGYPSWDYYSEDRNRGTMLCYHKHRINENPYVNVGEQDITAHVNFSSVKKWGEEIGIRTAGYCGQGAFMVSLGIDDYMNKIIESSNDFQFEIARIKKLILPQGMGESHKVMIQHKGVETMQLRGFSLRNQIKSL